MVKWENPGRSGTPPWVRTTTVCEETITVSTHSIRPFPGHLDRARFGDYLSGLTDGEGHFGAFMTTRPSGQSRFHVVFQIGLRADDLPVLELVRSYFGCGRIDRKKQYAATHNPQLALRIDSAADLAGVVVPHFLAHPLYAKKAADFEVWRAAVEVAQRVSLRQQPGNAGRGRGCKWSKTDEVVFAAHVTRLKSSRLYKS